MGGKGRKRAVNCQANSRLFFRMADIPFVCFVDKGAASVQRGLLPTQPPPPRRGIAPRIAAFCSGDNCFLTKVRIYSHTGETKFSPRWGDLLTRVRRLFCTLISYEITFRKTSHAVLLAEQQARHGSLEVMASMVRGNGFHR